VLVIAPLANPGGEFLAGVGPIGDAETGFEWRLYRGRDESWQRLAWPPEAIPRSLHAVPSGGPLFAVPFSNAIFGRGQAWGLMRSTDGGRSWQQALEGLDDPYVMGLALPPVCPARQVSTGTPQRSARPASPSPPGDQGCPLFAITWYRGVYRSSDAGQSWEPMPLEAEGVEPSGGANPYDLALAVSPDYGASAGDGLLLASFSRGLYRRTAEAESWETVPLTVTAVADDFDPPQAQLTAGAIAFSPDFGTDGTLYLYSGYAGLFRSADRGVTWQSINRRLPLPPPFVADFHLAAASAQEAYVLLASNRMDAALKQPIRVLYRTRDAGRSWESLLDPPTLGWVSTFALTRDAQGRAVLHLGGSQGGVSSHVADTLSWD
jgi:hypothetical protein